MWVTGIMLLILIISGLIISLIYLYNPVLISESSKTLAVASFTFGIITLYIWSVINRKELKKEGGLE